MRAVVEPPARPVPKHTEPDSVASPRTLSESDRAARPWLAFYEAGVPESLSYPDITLDGLLRATAAKYPHQVCTSFLGARLTYAQVDQLVDRFASGLAQLGVQHGDRVALMLPNCPQYVIAHFAVLRMGAILVPCNPQYTARELTRQLTEVDAKALVVLSKMLPQAVAAREAGAVQQLIVTSIKDFMLPLTAVLFTLFKERTDGHHQPLPPGATRFRQLLHTLVEPVTRAALAEEPAVLQYTGGTTGIPKAALLTHRALVANAFQTRAWFQKAEVGRETILGLMPLFHVYGLTVVLHLGVVLAAKLILVPRFDVDDLLETIARERPTLFPGAPRVYVALTDAIRRGVNGDLSSIRACLSGSAPLPREVADAFERLSRGVVVEGYGLTESSPVTHANPLFGKRRVGTVGLPLPDVECRICDLEDPSRVLGFDALGEVCVRGPNLMRAYWRRPDETARVLRDGWLLTGDIGRMDSDGYLKVVDRKKEMIIVNGLKVFPREVEEVLYAHPGVLYAAAVGIPDPTHGEVVKAFVQLKPGVGATPDELREHCARALAKFKVPVAVEIRQSLPVSNLGKVLRKALAVTKENHS
jgi:long-chain acyl-CoA synthetase